MQAPKSTTRPPKAASNSAPLDADREPTKEEIMDDIRQGLRDIRAGFEGQDAVESLEKIEREAMVDANES